MPKRRRAPCAPAPRSTVAYIRVSTAEQAEHGFSLEAQRTRLAAYATALERDLGEVYADEGASASMLRRPALRRLLDDVRAGRIAAILVTKLDHLTRSAAFLEAARADRLFPMYFLAAALGLRFGELLALTWPDVDFVGRTISVRGSLSEDAEGNVYVGPTKTKSSARTFPADDRLLAVLREHQATQGEPNPGTPAFVFRDTYGGPLRRENVRNRSFYPLLKAAGLPRVRFHDLRSLLPTLMLASGHAPHVAARVLGHAKTSTTLDVYGYALPGTDRAAVEQVATLLLGASGSN